jgi:YVTN family beta-propeller protein
MLRERYDRVAMGLHWLVALLALTQITLGWWMLGIPKSPPGLRADWFNVHKSIGITLGVLMLARLAWRLAHRPPPLPASVPRWQVLAAHANHWLLYALLIAQPIVGYLGSSFTRYPVKYFGTTLPSWGWDSPALKDLCSAIHFTLACAITALVALHIAAALKHLLLGRDGVFQRMWPRFSLLQYAFFVSLAAIAFAAAAADGYVANEKSGSVSILDTARDEVIAEIRTGTKPRGMAASRDGKMLYVSDQAANALLVVDVAKRAVASKIDLGESPEGVYISADGKWIAAAVEVSNSVAFVDVAAGKLAFSVKTEGKNPEHAVFSPDGRWVFVSAEEAYSVDIIDLAARKQIASVKVGRRPRGIAFTPDGKRAYVACELANTVYAIDVQTRQVLAEIPAREFSNGVTMRPDGERVFVSNGRAGTVSVIEVSSNKVIATIEVGKRPWNMAITPDGAKLYVANGRSNSVSVIDARANAKLKDIPVGEAPWGVVIR